MLLDRRDVDINIQDHNGDNAAMVPVRYTAARHGLILDMGTTTTKNSPIKEPLPGKYASRLCYSRTGSRRAVAAVVANVLESYRCEHPFGWRRAPLSKQ